MPHPNDDFAVGPHPLLTRIAIKRVGKIQRKLCEASKPIIEIAATEAGVYTLKEYIEGSMSSEVHFRDGQQVEWKPHGVLVRSVFTIESPAAWEENQEELPDLVNTRRFKHEVEDDELTIRYRSKGVEATRVLTRK